jgi:hypothetical protein
MLTKSSNCWLTKSNKHPQTARLTKVWPKKNPAERGFSLTAKNYFLGASAGAAGAAAGAAAAGAAASAGLASAAGAAGAAGAAAGAGAGAGAASSFLPQAAKAAAAITAAKTRDLVMIIILKVSKKQFPGNCHQV